jgi:hypothetical protein
MRGDDGICGSFFNYIDLEKRVHADHPLRVIRQIANVALKSLSADFGKLYSPIGRGSIPPERLGATDTRHRDRLIARMAVLGQSKDADS